MATKVKQNAGLYVSWNSFKLLGGSSALDLDEIWKLEIGAVSHYRTPGGRT